jgi:hypothetical protein
MVEMAEIFRRYGPQYRAKYGDKMLPGHWKVMYNIERCRTVELGGHVYTCEECEETIYHYHSCRDRHGWMGMVGVLHTWGRNLAYHPHVHYVVPGGGLAADGTWRPSRKNFLLPVKALSKVFRAKFRDALRQCAPDTFAEIPAEVWKKEWVVHSQPVGNGLSTFKYLAPYIFRVAETDQRKGDVSLPHNRHRYTENVYPSGRRVHPPFLAARARAFHVWDKGKAVAI